MPIIRLRVERESPVTPCQYREPLAPGSHPDTVPVLRVTTLARIESGPRRPTSAVRTTTALVDTGAWLSVVETAAWEEYERAGLLEFLPLTSGGHAASVGGRASGYLLGRLWISLHDFQFRQPTRTLPVVPVVAQLLTNRQCALPYPVVLGLHRGVFDGRKLTREATPVPAAPLPPNHTSDCGAWFGQEWFLESA